MKELGKLKAEIIDIVMLLYRNLTISPKMPNGMIGFYIGAPRGQLLAPLVVDDGFHRFILF